VLESDELVEHRGDVRAMHGYSGEPPMVADIVITTGDYSDPQCEVWQSGHYYYWQGCNPQQGGIWNIHAVPTTQKIEDGIDELELWQNVSFFGFEVERIDYDDGSWWTDAGCNTLLIYWLCRNDT
jgi:hypothetical protein